MLFAFLSVGILFTLRTKAFQITHINTWLQNTFLQIFHNKHVRNTNDSHAISQFQSCCTALAATIGTGNIAGVATAIVTGGPGAVFWMWISAVLGMMTIYAEAVLGIKYRYKNEKGDWIGGAMIYIERGLSMKWLAILFALFCCLASFGIGNMTQANSISTGLKESFGIDTHISGILLMLLISLVILGGIKRIALVTEKVVPFMALFYLIGGCFVILSHLSQVPNTFKLILSEAFRIPAIGGGTLGYGIAAAMRKGISRGVFSNEAGLGSSVIVHSASDVRDPVIQGMWGIFEVFTDTIVVCTITAFTILTSGVYDKSEYLIKLKNNVDVVSGTALTSRAFTTVIPFGGKLVTIGILLFAFSTLLGWSYYGERAAEYLFGLKAIPIYQLLFIGFLYIGSVSSLNFVWDISDTLNGFMAIPNLIALVLLSNEVIEITNAYLQKEKTLNTNI